MTPLRPGGGETGGQRVEVTTEGAFVASGSRLRVVAIDRRHTFVRVDDDRGVDEAPAEAPAG